MALITAWLRSSMGTAAAVLRQIAKAMAVAANFIVERDCRLFERLEERLAEIDHLC